MVAVAPLEFHVPRNVLFQSVGFPLPLGVRVTDIYCCFFIRSSFPQYYSIFSPQKHLRSFSHLNKDFHFVAFAK